MQQARIYGVLIAVSLALYGNTWPAGFAFDDNFAVVRYNSAPSHSFS